MDDDDEEEEASQSNTVLSYWAKGDVKPPKPTKRAKTFFDRSHSSLIDKCAVDSTWWSV